MSGRIRTIKPELLEDAATAGLSHEAFRLYVGGILLADDYGNLRAMPKQLDGAVFWSCESRDILANISELVRVGLWQLYEVSGQLCASIRNWEKHQKVDHAGKPRVPSAQDARSNAINPVSLDDLREIVASLTRSQSEGLAPDLIPGPHTRTTTNTSPCCDSASDVERRIFDYWVEKRGKDPKRTKFTTKRRSKVRARLRDYPESDIRSAIDGVARSPHHRGENETKQVWDDLELICRDGEHLEMFRDMPDGGRQQPQQEAVWQ